MKREVVERVVRSLGKGFDLTADFRLKFCKGEGDERLVILEESSKRDLHVPGFGTFHDVSSDINCDKGDHARFQSDMLDFNKMSEYFNQKSSVTGKMPSGYFNATFGLQNGTWAKDAANVKCLGLDGYFITLFNFHIDRPYRLRLTDNVRNAVPSSWDPPALARFIERYGTHVVVGVGVGGQDVVAVKQDHNVVQYLPEAFNVFDERQTVAFNNFSMNSKDGITVICSKRGGDERAKSHNEWLITVPTMPDAINFSFIPISSLLKDINGSVFLSHAISLYLRYKPPLMDLQYFLEFTGPKTWAPIHNDLPLGAAPNMPSSYSSPPLHINFMGPKLYVNSTPVTTEKNPVTGMRLFLEGKKCNRLAIHLQHLSNTATALREKIAGEHYWQGSDQVSDHGRYFESLNGKKFSHVCTAPVKYNPDWVAQNDAVAFIVTGAQLHVKKHGSKSVLHLQLRFTGVSDHYVVQKDWAHGSSGISQRSGIFSAMSLPLTGSVHNLVNKDKNDIVLDSSVFPGGPPVPANNKILRFVDLSQLCRGPQDSPGHWLVTGARLYMEKGKVCLHVKFSLLHRLGSS
ncbi:PREDICTED: MACPF domain-containing protein At1g14780 [Tarenaya hassleriana]|uniref:MACPF domain-containing protein At1g14780 n=1 Tax=Tarenaya hassleriana TaxID=28532 RepID=UPI00053C0EE9|nr:PREDICTED: MACPF domain-containing protein At1g14780 [Tarenaya hassleriana]